MKTSAGSVPNDLACAFAPSMNSVVATPTVEQDLPGGARRLVQKADGIAATVVNGVVAMEDGEPTGNYAGQVLKGPLAARS